MPEESFHATFGGKRQFLSQTQWYFVKLVGFLTFRQNCTVWPASKIPLFGFRGHKILSKCLKYHPKSPVVCLWVCLKHLCSKFRYLSPIYVIHHSWITGLEGQKPAFCLKLIHTAQRKGPPHHIYHMNQGQHHSNLVRKCLFCDLKSF